MTRTDNLSAGQIHDSLTPMVRVIRSLDELPQTHTSLADLEIVRVIEWQASFGRVYWVYGLCHGQRGHLDAGWRKGIESDLRRSASDLAPQGYELVSDMAAAAGRFSR